jgi:hypothetical protein
MMEKKQEPPEAADVVYAALADHWAKYGSACACLDGVDCAICEYGWAAFCEWEAATIEGVTL